MPQADTLTRLERLQQWASARHDHSGQRSSLSLAAGDASFRRYYRLYLEGNTRMLMDAPPPQEDIRPFVTIAHAWRQVGLPVPEVYASDAEAGFVELEDLGDAPLHLALDNADDRTTNAHFERALALIDTLQNRADPSILPPYDRNALARELDLFPEWCLGQWLNMAPPPGWDELRLALMDTALTQPVVAVHRDYDAMNLMEHAGELYLIDFQDALAGPISYDLISLLHGRYRRFSTTRRAHWIEAFRQRAIDDRRLDAACDDATFLAQVNAMAAQRSLKVLGIFCRLTLRDTREGYLARLPHFLDHLEDSLAGLNGHNPFRHWVSRQLRPALMQKLTAAGVSM
ncbi:aminoglycoside phosphotransferase family protein [Halomonas huangheensis]|uniref:Aminoglycoside phosphotransferase domain-containing protein n=1 Tax=Halomonas huangheensis TaxID=1178482 RepID=W1N582_9GAMM|nr:phosphotransferase [Halomonas huangheensis]ALM51612.1 aminoglycoside phosphotransferase [Halomonas huangheensis]ERL50095.1 hypothetical protein BJB45_02935 [Halomonas huangheensis]